MKKRTNELIYQATERLTNKLMNLIQDKFIEKQEHADEIHKTYIQENALKEIKSYLQLHFTTIITNLLKKDFPEVFQSSQAGSSTKSTAIKPNIKEFEESKVTDVLNVTVHQAPTFSSEESRRNFYIMLNYHLESVFMAPLFVMTLASKWQQQAISLTAKEIRELSDEIKRLIRYENIVERPTNDREEFIRDVLVAIDALKQKHTEGKRRKKITITAIAEQMEYKGRASFYDDCSTHRIEFDDDLNIIDKRTGKPFVFSQ